MTATHKTDYIGICESTRLEMNIFAALSNIICLKWVAVSYACKLGEKWEMTPPHSENSKKRVSLF